MADDVSECPPVATLPLASMSRLTGALAELAHLSAAEPPDLTEIVAGMDELDALLGGLIGTDGSAPA